MIKIVDKADCCGCEACRQVCPKDCISMIEDKEGFLYPKVDESKCIGCNVCDSVCPVLNQDSPHRPIETLAAVKKNENIRMESSSGGVFTALAEYVINKGGVVFGARFDDNLNVIHDYADTIEGLQKFRGSKYVQSQICDTFKQARTFLKENRLVLFSGTPCQIAGLKKFLRKDYDNLIAVDIVCHGVPSPMVWRKYVESISPRPKGAAAGKNTVSSLNETSLEGVSFRDKRLGWKKFGFRFPLKAGNKAGQNSVSGSPISQEELFQYHWDNEFMQVFLRNECLRPSCYDCPAKSGKSQSDITLGDFWGIQEIHPEIDDDKGLSLILVNTEKGDRLMESTDCKVWPEDYAKALISNPAIEDSVKMPSDRSLFMNACAKYGFKKALRILGIRDLAARVRRKVKRLF